MGIRMEKGVAISAGVVAFKGSKVLVVRGLLGEHPHLGYCGLPKGLVHTGEETRDVAEREAREETGFRVKAGEEVGRVKYRNKFGSKEVRYFTGEFAGGMRGEPDGEFVWSGWVPVATALKWLSYESDKGILRKAVEMIRG